MSTIREILYQHAKGNSQRQISRSFDLSRDTIRKYIDLAKQENFSLLVSDAELNKIAIKVEETLYKPEPIQKSQVICQQKLDIHLILKILVQGNLIQDLCGTYVQARNIN